MPFGWQKLKATECPKVRIKNKETKTQNAVAIVANLTVIDYDSKENFEKDKILFPEILNHYVKKIRVIIVILHLMKR